MKYKRIAGLAFVAMFATLAITLPMGVWAEGDDADTGDSEAVTEVATEATVTTAAELKAAFGDTAISTIYVDADIDNASAMTVNRAMTIDGRGHTINSGSNIGLYVTSTSPVSIKDLTVSVPYSEKAAYGLYIDNNSTYDVTLENTTIRSRYYGVYDLSGYHGATNSSLTLKNSTIEWIDAEGKTVDYEDDTAIGIYASYGMQIWGMTGNTMTISGSKILGFRYGTLFASTATGGKLAVADSTITGRHAFSFSATATAEAPFVVSVKNSTLHGINNYTSTQENYATILVNSGSNYLDATLEDVTFTVAESEAGLSNLWANQYAISNRIAGTDNTNKITINGDTTYLVPAEYYAKKAQNTNFQEEPTWATDELEEGYENDTVSLAEYQAYFAEMTRDEFNATHLNADGTIRWYGAKTPANSGITVHGGTYSYNPIEFVAEGKDVYDLGPDGPYVVDDATTVSLPEETVYVKLGDTMDLGGYLTNIAKKYGTFGVAEDAAMTIGKETLVATATKTGTAIINFQLHNYKNEVDKSFSVVVYGIDSEDDANEAGSDEETHNEDLMASATNGVTRALLDSLNSYANASIENPGSVTLADGTKAEITANATEISRALANGGKIVAKLVEADVALNDTDSAKVKAKMAEGAKVAKTLDYAILLSIDSSNDSTMLGKIIETATDLGITVDVSGVEAEEDGYRRAYQVIRLHDGEEEATALGGTYSAADKTVNFASNKFSTFTLAYVDTQVVIDNGDDNAEDVENTETPDTGTFTGSETSVSAGNVVAIVAALAVITAVVVGAVKFAKR